MSDGRRSRSRSADRSPARDRNDDQDNGPPPSDPADNGGGDEVKLYIGNLDYCKFWFNRVVSNLTFV